MQSSFDSWTPALMDRALAARAPYRSVVDAAWRDERLLRYVYWLQHGGEHPPFNVICSWTDKDLEAEIRLWEHFREQQMDDQAAGELIREKLETAYGMSLEKALELGASPELASLGLPIWNERIGALLPQVIGDYRLCKAIEYESSEPGFGLGYQYRSQDHPGRLDLYVYTKGFLWIGPGITDGRVLDEFESSVEGALIAAQNQGATAAGYRGPQIETLKDIQDQPAQFVNDSWSVKGAGIDEYTNLWVTGLNGAFLKVRYSVPSGYADSEAFSASVGRLNLDLAAFCSAFSGIGNDALQSELPVRGHEWHTVQDTDDIAQQADRLSIARHGDSVFVWVRLSLRETGLCNVTNREFRAMKWYMEVDVGRRQFRMHRLVLEYVDGADGEPASPAEEWRPLGEEFSNLIDFLKAQLADHDRGASPAERRRH